MFELDFKDIYVYYINPDNHTVFLNRRPQIEKLLNSIHLKYQRFCPSNAQESRIERIAMAHHDVAMLAIQNNKYPFLILEDDCQINTKLPSRVLLPECDIIYWGASKHNAGQGKLQLEDYNSQYYRLKNSLSTHALMFVNERAATKYAKYCYDSSSIKNHIDLYLTKISHSDIFLTPKDGPYFYQNDNHTKPVTQFLWKDILDDIHYNGLF